MAELTRVMETLKEGNEAEVARLQEELKKAWENEDFKKFLEPSEDPRSGGRKETIHSPLLE